MTDLPRITSLFLFGLLVACQPQWNQQPSPFKTEKQQPSTVETDRQVGGPCECCEAISDGMPENLAWEAQISKPNELGEPLEVSGTIFKQDGKTPAEGVVLYVYHTDSQGLYSAGPRTSACAERHGHLRGWVKTGADGRYRFHTIRPASYPNSNAVQHIHPIIKEPGLTPYWIDEFLFDDDPYLAPSEVANLPMRGGSGIMKMHKKANGTWSGERNIILGKNIPGY